jgi:hypothetical protein
VHVDPERRFHVRLPKYVLSGPYSCSGLAQPSYMSMTQDVATKRSQAQSHTRRPKNTMCHFFGLIGVFALLAKTNASPSLPEQRARCASNADPPPSSALRSFLYGWVSTISKPGPQNCQFTATKPTPLNGTV